MSFLLTYCELGSQQPAPPHTEFSRFPPHTHGLEIKPHGNGLVIKDRHGKHTIKASSLARSLAKGNLEKRLGRFQPAGVAVDAIESKDSYQAKPLQRQSPERDKLLAEYRACMTKSSA